MIVELGTFGRLLLVRTILIVLLVPLFCSNAMAEAPAVVSHVKVLSDKIEDVSSLDAWRSSFIKPGMSEEQQAIAIWSSVVKYRHQEVPPLEYLEHEDQTYDPIKMFNVYGYSLCSGTAAYIESLARYSGMEARGWAIVGHSVPEIRIKGHWAMFDASLINYFRLPDGRIAGVEEISDSVADWYGHHPEFKNDHLKLYDYMRNSGWRRGPTVLAGAAGYDENGWQAAATHGWGDSMVEYDRPKDHALYDYNGAVGYEVNIQLRPGEVLTRNWSNKRLQVNSDPPSTLNCSTANPTDQLRYSAKWGDLAPGRIGNGTLVYTAPLSSPAFLRSALSAENVSIGGQPVLHAENPDQAASLVIRMPSSYVYLDGAADVDATIGAGGKIDVAFSENNGLDWKPIANLSTSGQQHLDLGALVLRRYDYRLRFTIHGAGTGLNALTIHHDVQHSQRPLPALAEGDNHISFSSGAQEGTITVQGTTNVANKDKNIYVSEFHPVLSSGMAIEPAIRPQKDRASITFPIETPGDVSRLRIGVAYRARDIKDVWTIETSFDGGKNWRPVGELHGPYQGMGSYLIFDQVPKKTRSALVRFSGTERNTCVIFDARISADYVEPHGGFAPIKVTYRWEEAGQEKQDVHIARSDREGYTIQCATKPLMKSIVLERADDIVK